MTTPLVRETVGPYRAALEAPREARKATRDRVRASLLARGEAPRRTVLRERDGRTFA